MDKEIRSITDKPQLSDDGKTIFGYAAVFNSFSQDLGGFVEIIRPGAFDRSIAAGADVRCAFNHEANMVLGRNKSGSLRLTVDARGLKYEVNVPDTTYARDLITSMKRGDIDGSSFMFSVPDGGDDWRKEATRVIRELRDVDLMDVAPVTYPAYLAATSAARSLEKIKADDVAAASAIAAAAAADLAASIDLRRRRLALSEKL